MNKRHAKPTTAQLVARIYRQQLAMASNQADIGDIAINVNEELAEIRAEMRSALAMLSQRVESFRVLADHCARLLREKETLMKMHQANDYMSFPQPLRFPKPVHVEGGVYPKPKCGFVLLHRPGIRCAVCGELELPHDAY